ncbi:MAG: hypothetical protein ACYTFZ_08220 [Planctomycetota bacterium]|jgi:transposase-like protein
MKQRIEKFRRQLRRQMPHRGRGVRFPAALVAEAVGIANEAQQTGWDLPKVARALDVHPLSLKRWCDRAQEAERYPAAMKPVAVLTSPAPEKSTGVVVHGPHSLRVEGLSLDEVAELWRKLS